MERIKAELIDVGVDWITSTSPKTDKTHSLWTRTIFWLQEEARRGMTPRPWTMSGYRGLSAGSVQRGQRDDGICVRLGGHMAQKHWRTVFDACGRCSRLDLQYTIRFNCDPSQIIARHYRQAKREKKRCPGGPTYSMFQTSDTSSTLYLGSRTSDLFLRIYDKWRQSKQDAWSNCVRFEMELKNVAATRFAFQLVTAADVDLCISRYVAGVLEERGHSPWISEARRASFDAPLPAADDTRSLVWMAAQVAPVVARLCDNGKRWEVLSALGLLGERPGCSVESNETFTTWTN